MEQILIEKLIVADIFIMYPSFADATKLCMSPPACSIYRTFCPSNTIAMMIFCKCTSDATFRYVGVDEGVR